LTAICIEWLEIAQWSQWKADRKPPSLFRMVPPLTPYNPLPPKWRVKGTLPDLLHDTCCHWAHMIEDIDKISSVYNIMSHAGSPFAKLLFPLLLLLLCL